MIIAHNIAALNAQRKMGINTKNTNQALEKLSSGLRINRAADDAAGLAISEKMRGQIRGLQQAGRNIQDSISLIQTAEGGLNEVHALLQRGRELAVQAVNDTLTASDRQAIQEEITQIKAEIDNIADGTEFNNIKLLNRLEVELDMEELQKFKDNLPGMLKYAEELVRDAYGLQAQDKPINIQFKNIDNKGGVLAQVRYGGSNPTTMEIDVSDLGNYEEPHGSGGEYNRFDATIVHEMVHAVFAETINSVPIWFNEGAAEYLSGGADRLYVEANNLQYSGKSPDEALTTIIDSIVDGNSWGQQSINYAAAYGAVSYLDTQLTGKISDFLTDMKTKTFEEALLDHTPTNKYASVSDFINDYKENGITHLEGLYKGYDEHKNVGSAQGGHNPSAIGPGKYVLPEGTDPLTGWDETFLALDEESLHAGPLLFQIGANAGQNLKLELESVNSSSLGISQVNLVANSSQAITSFDNAINKVSTFRSKLGAVQNRMEHAYNNAMNSAENLIAAESRIRDTDMAKSMMEFTKNNILTQASQAMLAQAQQLPQGVLQLLQ